MNMLEISDSPFVSTSLGTQAALLASVVPNVQFMGRQITIGHAFPYANSIHHPYNRGVLDALLGTRTIGVVHTHMPMNESEIGTCILDKAVWVATPIIDSDVLPPSWVKPIRTPDHVIALGAFDEKILKRYVQHVTRIPHFIHPVYTQEQKGVVKPPAWKKEGDFVLVSVGRPTLRKNLPGLIAAMYQLVKIERLPVKLYLHASMDDVEASAGIDFLGIIHSFGLDECIVCPAFNQAAGVSAAVLRDIYRCAEAYISTDLGEALGITRLEAMACGLPIIVPEHTSGPELVGDDRGMLIGCEPCPVVKDGIIRTMPKTNEVVDAVKWLMDNPTDREAMGETARAHVVNEYNNHKTADKWKELLTTYEVNEVRFQT